ncbi:MAG: beta strand repeat-containing protein [Janthinobacterium lividum]
MPLLAGCAGSGGSSPTTTTTGSGSNPPAQSVPVTIATVSPTNIPVGSGDLSLTVTGTGFTSGSVVSVNNAVETTAYVSATQLKATVPAAQLSVGAVLSVGVKSETASVTADPAATALSVDNPVPSLAFISPKAATIGMADTTVTVTGTNFVPGVALAVNGTPRSSTYVSATQMTAQLSAADFTAAGTLPLNVINPKPGGGTSGTSSLAVNNPLPVIASVSPSTIATGAGDTNVTISGQGLLPSTTVLVNGATRPATLADGKITFTLSSKELTAVSTFNVTVSNPLPGGGASNAFTLQVGAPSPTITALSPAAVPVNSAATTVSITGTGFVSGSTVQFNGTTRAGAAYVSSTQMTLPLAASDFTYSGTYSVVVTNPAASGGPSRSSTFTVQALTPVLATITPNALATNSGTYSITATGTNFTASSKLNWNGTQIPTTYSALYNYDPAGNSTYTYTLIGTVSADLLGSAGTASVTVSTPTAAAISNALTVSISNPPVPTVTSLSPNAVPVNADAKLSISGTGFAKSSVAAYKGQPLATTFNSNTSLSVTIPATSLALPGNGAVTVTTPAPGGGISTAVPLTVYVPLVSNNMVFNPVNGLAYLSIPSTGSTVAGNSIVSFDPATGALGTPIFVGSEPGVMAISDDGTTLWVALNGTTAIRQVDLVHAIAGPQYSISAIADYSGFLAAIVVLPGTTNSVAVASGYTLGIYDSGVLRGSTVSVNSVYALQADGTRSELYTGGYNTVQAYTYDGAGLRLKSSGTNNYSNNVASSSFDEMQLAGGKLYTDYGRVFDPESGGQLGTFMLGTTIISGPTLYDSALSQVYVLTSSSGNGSYNNFSQVLLLNPADYSNTGKSFAWNIPYSITTGSGTNTTTGYLNPHRLARWGANGLIVHTKYAIFTAQSNVVKDQSSVSADLSIALTATGGTTTGSTATYTAMVKNAGPQAATDVAVSLQAPSTGTITSAISSVGACPSSNGCTLGTLASGASATITVQVLQTTAGTGTLNAQVQGSSNDASGSNNVATSSVSVTGATYNLVPTIVSLTPNAVKAGSSDTTLTVSGTNFAPGSQVMLGTTALTTTVVSSTQLTATAPTASLTAMTWSPVSVRTPTPGGGSSNTLPFTVFNVTTVGLNHIVYEPYSRKLYASVSSGSSTITGNSVVSIDPATGTFGTPVTFATAPDLLTLSSSGNSIFTTLAVPDNTTVQSVPMGKLDTVQGTAKSFSIAAPNGYYTGFPVQAIAVQPGTENTLAVSRTNVLPTIYDYNPLSNTIAARATTGNYYYGTCIAFLDATHLLSTYGSTVDYLVTAAGLTNVGSFTSPSECFQLSGSTAVSATGRVYTITNSGGTLAGTVVLGSTYNNALPALDTSMGTAFFAGNTSSSSYGNTDGLLSYALSSDLRSDMVNLSIPTIEGSSSFVVKDIVRWGQDGLAMVTSTGHLYLLRGPFVVPQELGTNTAATLTASSATALTAGSGNTLLTLSGTNFQPGVAVTWNGAYRTTTVVDGSHITVAIPTSDLSTAGSGKLVATNPGATSSNALTVTVQ